MRIKNLYAKLAGAAIAAAIITSCKTTSASRASKSKDNSDGAQIVATRVIDYDIPTLKSHLANAQNDELKDQQLWSLFLEEPTAKKAGDTPCPGLATETYYFIGKGDTPNPDYFVVTGKPMPMNGPCGIVINLEVKKYAEVGGALIESSPLGEIGAFDKIKLSIKQALTKSVERYKEFKYTEGVKIYRHLHPAMWDYPWYAIYGSACGANAIVTINAETGDFTETMDSPLLDGCQEKN